MKALWAIGIVAIAACAPKTSTGGGDIGDSVGDWSGTLDTRGNSRVNGTANVQSAVAASVARITIKNSTSGAEHPWHVHVGACGSGGGIVGNPNSYPVLKVGDGGEASAVATLNVALDENAKYSVNVHKSPAEMSVVISCGEIKN